MTTPYVMNPLLHIQHIPYKYEQVDRPSEEVAYVTCPTVAQPYYHIVLNTQAARKIYEASWVQQKLTFEQYCGALTAHETFHVLYETFSRSSQYTSSALWKQIDNILEDSRIEHFGTVAFPLYAEYIHLLLASIKRDIDFSKVDEQDNPVFVRAQKNLDTLFYLARFGVILPGSDEAFVQFLLPLVLTSKRSSRKDLIIASNAVYRYFEQLFGADDELQEQLGKLRVSESGIGEEEMRGLLEGLKPLTRQNGQGSESAENHPLQVMASGMLDMARDHFQPKQVAHEGGIGNTTVDVPDQGNEFAQQTIATFEEEILALAQAFRRLFHRLKRVASYEGDFNFKRQNQFLANLLSGSFDEQRDWQVFRRVVADLDVAVVRDVSISTAGMKEVFAQCSIILHAAVEHVQGVRSLHVDFSDDAKFKKHFFETVLESTIEPLAVGGTQFDKPVQLLQEKAEFRASKRLLFVITDGWFAGTNYMRWFECLLDEKNVLPIFVQVDEVGSETDDFDEEPARFIGPLEFPLYRCSLRTLPQLFYHVVECQMFS